MDKLYERINWENEPSISTPLNEINLNKMDYSIDAIDDRVITIDTTKAKQSDLLQSLKTVTYDTSSGVFLFTWNNGTTLTVDLNIEKIPVSFSMSEAGVITMTTADGSTYTADVASLIKTYSFTDSSRIDFTVTTDASGNKTVQADIVDGSITSSKIEASLVANINNANNYAISSKSYAVGGTGTRSGENTDNSKYYYEQARQTDVGQLVPRVTNLETGLSDTKESLNKYEQSGFLKSKNLFNLLSVTNGQALNKNGVASDLDTYMISDYIDVSDLAKVTFSYRKSESVRNYIRVHAYNASKTWLKQVIQINDDASVLSQKYVLTIDSDVKYVRISMPNFYLDYQLEEGSEATSYLEYAMSNVDLGNEVEDLKESLTHQTELGYLQRNIFNKYNVNEGTLTNGNVGLYIDATNKKIADLGQSYHIHRFVCIPCKPNKTYTVSLGISTVMRIATTSSLPSLNVATSDVISREKSTSSLTITTNASANYLCVQFFIASDGDVGSFSTLCDALMIEEGSVAHSYIAYGYGNTDLTKELNFAIDNDYIGTNLLDNEYTLGINHVGTSANNRSLSKAITVSSGQKIYVKCCNNPNSLQYLVGEYTSTESSSYISALGSWTSANTEFEYTIPSNVNSVRIVLKRANESAMVASDLDGLKISITSEPYVPSNADLKESLAQIDSVQNIDSRFTLSGDCSVSNIAIRRSGKMISFYMRIALTSSLNGIITVGTFADKPIGQYAFCQINNPSEPYNPITSAGLFVNSSNGALYLSDNGTLSTNRNYFVNGTYMINE